MNYEAQRKTREYARQYQIMSVKDDEKLFPRTKRNSI